MPLILLLESCVCEEERDTYFPSQRRVGSGRVIKDLSKPCVLGDKNKHMLPPDGEKEITRQLVRGFLK